MNSKIINHHESFGWISYITENFDIDYKYEKYFIITPQIYLHNYNIIGEPIETYIPVDVLEQTKNGNIKIIFDFSTEDIGFKNDYIFRNNSTNTYEQLDQWATYHNVSEHCLFITMFETTSKDFIEKKSIEILYLNSTTLRFEGFNYDSAVEISKNIGKNKSILWLNRRLRQHRLDSIEFAIEYGCDFDDMNFSLIGSKYETQTTHMTVSSDVNKIKNRKYSDYILNNLYNKEINLKEPENNWMWLSSEHKDRIYTMFDIRAKSAVEVVSEFTCYDCGHILSEKIIQPIISKKPFIVIGDKEILKSLKKLGFKTFDSIWDEEYDELDYDDRLKMIAQLISNLQKTFDKYTLDEYNNVVYFEEIQKILEHNYNHYYNVYKPEMLEKWKRIF